MALGPRQGEEQKLLVSQGIRPGENGHGRSSVLIGGCGVTEKCTSPSEDRLSRCRGPFGMDKDLQSYCVLHELSLRRCKPTAAQSR